MTTMLSLILAFMLSMGGSPAASVNPAGCPGDTGIQAPVDNNRTINHFSEDYNQKTASRANSKKTGETPSIKELETIISIRFSLFSNEKLRQARYSNHKSYRFNSVDPIINREEALYNPQLWNLYAYCRNNPITFFDPDGREEKSIWQQFKEFINPAIPQSNIIPDIIIINGKTMTTGQAIDEAVEMAIDIEKGNYFEELLADLIEAGGEPVIKKPGTRVNKDGTPKSAEDQLTQIEQKQKLLRKQRKENYKKEIENNKQKSIDSIEKSKQNVKDMLKKNKGNKDDV